MALSAVSCIQRGLTNLRANWELVIIASLQSLLTATLVVIGFAPPAAALGLGFMDLASSSEADWMELAAQVSELMSRGPESWLLLGASLLVSSAIWLMAFLVYCFFQGGVLGVLMTGDRQASAGTAPAWPWFRTYSGRDLRGWGGKYLWRYFWLLSLIAALSLVWLLLVMIVLGLTALGGEQWGTSAAFGIGCGGAIPIAFGLLLLVLWANLAQVDLAQEHSGVGTALRRSLSLLGRRLGAVVVIFLVALVLGVLIGVVISILSLLWDLLVPESGSGLWIGALVQFGFSAIEIIVGSVVTVGLSAAYVSLVRSEGSEESLA